MKTSWSWVAVIVALSFSFSGCKKETPPPAGKPADAAKQPSQPPGHHGKMIELGSAAAGSFTVRAARADEPFKAGGDAPIDVHVSGGKVTAVRFWIGVADAKGSVKALAQLEDVGNSWHAHTEVPDPLPAGSKLWVEVEGEAVGKATASFDLKN
jgi:predicted small lipoprotein YifL